MNKIKEKIMNVFDSNGFLKAATVNAAASTAMVVSSATSVGAYAAEEGTGMASITGGMSTLTSVMGDLWSFMVANPLMCVYMAAGIASVCFGLIRRGKRASR